MQTRFGPSGNGNLFYASGNANSYQAPQFLSNLGLTAYEYSFGRGVNLSSATAKLLADEADKYDIALSVHAPYYINLGNTDEVMVEKSFQYLLDSAYKARELHAKRVIFHAASVGKLERANAVQLATERLKRFTQKVYDLALNDITFCPETMGKINQIGTLQEVVDFCLIDEIYLPTIDFGHLYARSLGEFCGENLYGEALEYIIGRLGERAKSFHIHFSKIEFSAGGEVKHLTYDNESFGPDFLPLAKNLHKYGCTPIVICESDGTQAEDALRMQNIYLNIKENNND